MKRAKIALKVFILPSIVFAGLLWAIVWANGSKEPERSNLHKMLNNRDFLEYQVMDLKCPKCEKKLFEIHPAFFGVDKACSSGSIDECDWACIAHRNTPIADHNCFDKLLTTSDRHQTEQYIDSALRDAWNCTHYPILKDNLHSFDAGRISRPMTPDEIRLWDENKPD